jgi:hypothetical protein
MTSIKGNAVPATGRVTGRVRKVDIDGDGGAPLRRILDI